LTDLERSLQDIGGSQESHFACARLLLHAYAQICGHPLNFCISSTVATDSLAFLCPTSLASWSIKSIRVYSIPLFHEKLYDITTPLGQTTTRSTECC
jgi:hypothetical protein